MLFVNDRSPTVMNFPNGEHTLKFIDPNILKSEKIRIDWYYDNDQEIFSLRLLATMLNPDNQDITCYIPYLPYARMDRVEDNNPYSLDALISILPKGWKYIVMEPHSYRTVELFEAHGLDLKVIWFRSLDLDDPRILRRGFVPAIILPDKGAVHRYTSTEWDGVHHIRDEIITCLKIEGKVFVCSKERDFSTGKITSQKITGILEYDKDSDTFSTRDIETQEALDIISNEFDEVVILDDICSYGGTFSKIIDGLRPVIRGNDKISVRLSVAHCEDSVYKGTLPSQGVEVETTDSILRVARSSNMTDGDFETEITSARDVLLSVLMDEEEN